MKKTLSDCFARMGKHDDTIWEPLIHCQFEQLQKFFELVRNDLESVKDINYLMESEDTMILELDVRDASCVDNIIENIERRVPDSFDISYTVNGSLVNIVIKHSEMR